jgi:two-component system nitrogen regulation response regulator GlnG
MDGYTDPEQTLPSLTASTSKPVAPQALVLTLVFHPQIKRIGEWARWPVGKEERSWVVGRRCPDFAPALNDSGSPLDEPHVSRRALEMFWRGDSVVLRKLPDANRCRLEGRELRDQLELDRAQLEKGVSLQLGHAIVLFLRLFKGKRPPDSSPLEGGMLLGHSAYMSRLRDQIRQIAVTDLDVLVRGETGTGKELVARSIHQYSARAKAPLICVNMAAIPSGLAASALFGSARGAYTGAQKAGAGYFQQADGGTLFLDEIGDTPDDIQPQLLRALQQREIQVVGGDLRKVDVRIISATDANLDVASPGFRAALRHRLGAAEIKLLPLREHPEDVAELFVHFLELTARELNRVALLPGPESSEPDLAVWAELFQRLLASSWMGNVRELANVARQVILASEDGLVLPDDLPMSGEEEGDNLDCSGPAGRQMSAVTAKEFERSLYAHCFEVAPAAREMGVSRQSVYRRMEETPGFRLARQVPEEELSMALRDNPGELAAAALQLRVSLSGLRARLRNSKRLSN